MRQERRPERPARHVSLRPLNTSARPAGGDGPENESVWTERGARGRSGAEQRRAARRGGEEKKGVAMAETHLASDQAMHSDGK